MALCLARSLAASSSSRRSYFSLGNHSSASYITSSAINGGEFLISMKLMVCGRGESYGDVLIFPEMSRHKIGYSMIADAEEKGLITPEKSVLVESMSGNTSGFELVSNRYATIHASPRVLGSKGEDTEWVNVNISNPESSSDNWVGVLSPAKFEYFQSLFYVMIC